MKIKLEYNTANEFIHAEQGQEWYKEQEQKKARIQGALSKEEDFAADDVLDLYTLYDLRCAIDGTNLAGCLWEILNDTLRTKHITAESLLSKESMDEYCSNRKPTEEYLTDIVIDVMDALRLKVRDLLQDRGVSDLVDNLP